MTVIRDRQFHQRVSKRLLTGVFGGRIGILTGYGIVVTMMMMDTGVIMAGGSSILTDTMQI